MGLGLFIVGTVDNSAGGECLEGRGMYAHMNKRKKKKVGVVW
jgi:hypothetical protein